MKTQLIKRKNVRRYVAGAVLVAWFVILGLVAMQRQAILDWVKLRNYDAPAPIAQLSTDDTMTAYAQKVFYVNSPQVETKSTFNTYCTNQSEQTVVLGCYHGGQNGIYLLSVSDPRLNGIEQVTAAHEMLHAAYERLGSSKRRQVDGWLQDYYNHGLTDATVKAQIASYQKTEPHDVINEMHSIFGTEVAELPANLENYYRQYFADRSKITAFAAQYENEFTSRQNQITADDAELATLKAQIDTDENDAKTRRMQLDEQQNQLDVNQRNGDIAAYNAGVDSYNAQVNAYNGEVNRIRALVDQYNALVAARNSIVLEEQQLMSDITAQAAPVTK
jgi:Skp family chaperone for outer membrane proteins